MIFKRSLQTELIFYSFAVYASLVLVTLTFTLVKLLAQASDGVIDPKTVLVLLGYGLVNYQAIMLSLSVFLGTLLVFSRMWRDSDMVVWQASGLSLRRFVWPTLRFAIPVAILAAVFSAVISPWANQQAYEYRDQFEKRDDLSRIAPKQFRESSDGSRVFYVNEFDDKTQASQGLLIVDRQKNKTNTLNLVAAQQGRVVSDETGDRFLELLAGRRYQLPTEIAPFDASMAAPTGGAITPNNTPSNGLMVFEQYSVFLTEKAITPQDFVPYRQRGTIGLMLDAERPAKAELLWRLGVPVLCIILAFLAIPLSYFNPRSGKSAPLVASVLLFVTYMNALSLTQSYLASGKLKPWVAALSPHIAVLCLAIVLLLWRSQALRSSHMALRRPFMRSHSVQQVQTATSTVS